MSLEAEAACGDALNSSAWAAAGLDAVAGYFWSATGIEVKNWCGHAIMMERLRQKSGICSGKKRILAGESCGMESTSDRLTVTDSHVKIVRSDN